ncbi:MAG: hypothetical protein K8S98_07550 [Planctomycetes bacterium]|nr:hypothetical protein [Planctomycetota bacterium]
MKAFFHNMTVERWVILTSFIVALGLGGVGFFKFHRERVELEDALKADVIKLAQDTQASAMKYSKLYKEADLQELTGSQSNMESFVRTLATRKEASLGQIDVRISESPNTLRKGVQDLRYTLQPQNRERAFSRIGIANYLYLLESESRRLRVSHLRLTLSPKNLKEWDFPPNNPEQWFWDAEVLSRQKSDATK